MAEWAAPGLSSRSIVGTLWLSESMSIRYICCRPNAVAMEDSMNITRVFVASTAAFLILGGAGAKAGQTINDVGAIACANDKWDVKEPKKDTSWSTTLADA